MTLYELITFDCLKHKAHRTMPEEVTYLALLKRVQSAANDGEDYTVDDTPTITDKEKHNELCSAIASRIFKDLALYGPRISGDVCNILYSVLKTLGRNPESK